MSVRSPIINIQTHLWNSAKQSRSFDDERNDESYYSVASSWIQRIRRKNVKNLSETKLSIEQAYSLYPVFIPRSYMLAYRVNRDKGYRLA